MDHEIVVAGGRVLDGTGNPWFRADVGIKDGKITEIGDIGSGNAHLVMDARGMVVCPGFIDIHAHSDTALLVNPTADSKVMQGVTTEVVGNCSYSAAPTRGETKDLLFSWRSREAKWMEEAGLSWDFPTLDSYLRTLQDRGVSMNVAALVGHGTVRTAVMGFEEREPTGKELKEMKDIVKVAMKDGAFGMSTGLVYRPSSFARTEEVVELCRVVAENGGIYATHVRGERDTVLEAVSEAIEIGAKAGIPVQVSHHKALDRNNWGKIHDTLNMMERARLGGVDITCDVYPYTIAGTGPGTFERFLVRYSGQESIEGLDQSLRDPSKREEIEAEIKRRIYWDSVVIVESPGKPELEGRTLAEVASRVGGKPLDVALGMAKEERARIRTVTITEGDLRTVMTHSLSMIGSDGYAIAPRGLMGKEKLHPRCYGTFVRVLAKYVRDERVLTLQEGIRKMTSMPAQKLGIGDRGLLRKFFWADLVVFDPGIVRDRGTFTDPHQFPSGIRYVLVNGAVVVDEAKHTGKLPGRVLRSEAHG